MSIRDPHLRLRIGGDNQVWVEERLRDRWDGWVVASRVVPDNRGLPMLGEIRIYASTSAAQTSGVPWTLIRRGVALSEHARFANNLIASAVHVRSSMKDVPSRQLALALTVAGFTARDVPQPAALRAVTGAVTRRGRPSVWTRADYARVALLYDDAVAAGRSPQQAVAKAIGRPVTVARNLIAKARKLELIPKAAKQGRWSLERLSRSQRLALSRKARHSSIRGGKR